MSDNEFRSEVVTMLEEHIKVHNPGELSAERRKSLDDAVHAHIDTLFAPDVEDSKQTDSSGYSKIRQWLSDFITGSTPDYRPKVAFAVVAVVSITTMTVLSMMKRNSTVNLPEFPQSLAAAGLDRYVQPLTNGVKSMVSTTITPRRLAFLTGVSKAGIDAVGDIKNPKAIDVATSYASYTGQTTEPLEWLKENVKKYEADAMLNQWLIHGYTIEVVSLAANRSMQDIDASYVQHALSFYQKETPVLDAVSLDGVPEQVLQNHEYLMSVNIPIIETPSDIEIILDRSFQIKVLVQ